MSLHAKYLRWLYRGGRPNRLARIQNRLYGRASALGIYPSRAGELEVVGRRSGRTISLPVVIADYEGERYVVAMLGERANRVQNLRQANSLATLRHGRSEAVRLEEIPAASRPEIIRRYLALAPGARPHIAVDRHASLAEFEKLAPHIPVFRVTQAEAGLQK